MMSLTQLFTVGSLFLLSIAIFHLFKQTRKPNTLPSPPKLPFIGNLHQLGSLLHRSLHKLSQQHGPLMLIHFGLIPTLIVSSADTAHEVMKVHDLAFSSRPPSRMAKKFFYDSHDVGFSPYGEYWRQVRRICVLHLLSLKRVQSFNNVKQEELKLMDMYAAGTHTTFTALEWTMAELIKHPEAMKRVQEEVREVVGQRETIEEEQLDQMNYMIAVIKESLRLHPPATLLAPRGSMEDTQVMRHHIPSKTKLMINAWSIGRDLKSWERPEEFWPDRFVDSSVDFRGQHMQFVPSGAGRRGCPGIEFAFSTIKLTLANILLHFDWRLPDGKEGESLDMSEESGISSHMKYGLVLEAKSMI